MTNVFKIRSEMDAFIGSLSLNRVDRFYPTALSKFLDISPSEAFNYLVERAGNDDQLILKWEVRCPECHRTIDVIDDRVRTDIECICGEETELSLNEIYPVFKINPSYKEYLKEELEKKKSKLALTNRKSEPLVWM